MITLKIDGINYDLPEGWNEVNLGKYSDISRIESKDRTNLFYRRELLSVLMGCDVKIVGKILKKDLDIIFENLQWVWSSPTMIDNRCLEIDGISYSTISTFDHITFDEIVSLEYLIKNDHNDCSSLCAVLYRPSKIVFDMEREEDVIEIEDFDDKNFHYRTELFKEKVMITDVLKYILFFSNGVVEYSGSIQNTLEQEEEDKSQD